MLTNQLDNDDSDDDDVYADLPVPLPDELHRNSTVVAKVRVDQQSTRFADDVLKLENDSGFFYCCWWCCGNGSGEDFVVFLVDFVDVDDGGGGGDGDVGGDGGVRGFCGDRGRGGGVCDCGDVD